MKTNCYYSTNLSSLNWIKDFNTGIYKIPISTINAYDYEHPAIDNIPLIEYNYTRNSILSNMSLNSFMILDGYFYVNFGNVDPNNSLSEFQMGLSSVQINAASDDITQSTKLELYSTVNNNITVTDNSNNEISPNSNVSRPPYYRSYIQPNSIFPLTIHNARITTQAVTTSSGNSSTSGVSDVEVNGSSVVIDGVAQIDSPILKPQSEWTSEDKLSIKNTLGLNGFVESVNSLIPETEISAEQVGTTYLLTQYNPTQSQYIPGKLYVVVSDTSTTPTSYKYQEVGSTSLSVGSVSNIRYTFVGDENPVLSLSWRDPDDLIINNVVVSKWQKTVVRYNEYLDPDDEANTGNLNLIPIEDMTYPSTPDDGTELVTITTRNQYNIASYEKTLEAHKIYFIRFFPCSTNGVYTIDTVNPEDNRCNTNAISWTLLDSYLENFQTQNSFLPTVGSTIGIKYLLKDRNTSNAGVYTRENVKNNLANGTMAPAVDTQWNVIGYNITVPRYIKYRKLNSETNTYDYVFVSSLDDSASQIQFKLLDNSTITRSIVTGTMCERTIVAGCRVYTRSYDENETEWTYTDLGKIISTVSTEQDPSAVFEYGSGPFAYDVPTSIVIDSDTYDFCGYTMTLQSRCALGSTGANGFKTTMQWNASSYGSAVVGQDKFPIISEAQIDSGYYYYDGSQYLSIKIFDEENENNNLSDTLINSYPSDVYIIDKFGKLKLVTAKYVGGILKQSIDGTNPTNPIEGHRYSKTVNGTTTNLIGCYNWQPNTVYTTADNSKYIYYDQKIYVVTTATTLSSSTTPDQDTTHYSVQIDLSAQTDTTPEGNGYCVYGTKIPVEFTINERALDTNKNMYLGSWYRFWINDKYGYSDNKWTKYLPYDVKSTGDMSASNGLRLKLLAEPDLLKQIIPSINPTYIYTNWVPYSINWEWKNSHYTWYPTDYFFPLSMYDVNLWNDGDGSTKLTTVFPDNTSRLKWYMKEDGTINKTSDTTGVNWWLRSPYLGITSYEYNVSTSGSSNDYYASISNGVCPACTIG